MRLQEAFRLLQQSDGEQAADLLERQISVTDLNEAEKADYGYAQVYLHLLQNRSLIYDTLIHYSLQYYKQHPPLAADSADRLFSTYKFAISQLNDPLRQEQLFREWEEYAASRHNPQMTEIVNRNLLTFYYKHRRYEKVIEYAHKNMDCSLDARLGAMYLLGLNYGRMHRMDSCLYYLSEAVRQAKAHQDPDTFHFMRNYADALSHIHPQEAVRYVRQILEEHPQEEATFHFTLATAYAQCGPRDSAEWYIRKAEERADSLFRSQQENPYYTHRINALALRHAWELKEHHTYDNPIGQLADSISLRMFNKLRDEQERQFVQNRLQAETQEAQSERQQLIILLLGWLLATTLCGALLFFYLRRKRERWLENQDKMEELQQMLREAEASVATADHPDSGFIRRILLQQLGLIRLMASTPTEQNQALLQRMQQLVHEQIPTDSLLVWEDLYPLIDIVYDQFHTRLLAVADGRLSEKELQLVCLLCAGFSTKEISVLTYQSVRTVYQRKSHIRQALQMEEKEDIVSYINAQG